MLAALQATQASVVAHVPGAARKTLQQFTSSQMAFSVDPLDMTQIAASCDWGVCHGGGGTTAALLLAGKPLMLFPMQMEQAMTARRLAALGVAASIPSESAAQFPRLLKRVLGDPLPAANAARFAALHAGYDQNTTIQRAADRCEALLTRHACKSVCCW